MRAVVQRVARAHVEVAGERVGAIGPGLFVLVGVRSGDTAGEAQDLAEKAAHLRIFDDEQGRLNRSALECGAEVLVVSQFTLYGDARGGRRPSYTQAARPEAAEPVYEAFADCIAKLGLPVQKGVFGAHMRIESVADGPVTILLDGERQF